MELKGSSGARPLRTKLRQTPWLRRLVQGLVATLVAGGCLLAIMLAILLQDHEPHQTDDTGLVARLRNTRLRVAANYLRGLTAQAPLLKIDIKFKNLQRLQYDRAQALQYRVMLSDSLSLVPVTITHGDKTVRARMRLKGDWTADNLEGDKWSFRVGLRGDNTLFGMKRFSLHHPRVRNYIHEWLFHKLLDREGVIGLRYMFVRLSLNGKDLGVYALEEHFEKRLIEHNQRREGPILKFDENPRWTAVRNAWPQPDNLGLSSMYSAAVDVFKSGTVLADSALYQQFRLAGGLLQKASSGELAAHKVFDADQVAAYFAVIDLMGAQHALSWHNLRFYYNPISSHLEPIGFDGNAGTQTDYLEGLLKGSGMATNTFENRILGDPVIFRKYVAVLERMADPAYLDSFLSDVGNELRHNLDVIYSEFPGYEYSGKIERQNQATIRRSLDPIKGIHAYPLEFRNGRLTLMLGNIQAWPIEITNLVTPDEVRLTPSPATVLWPHNPTQPVEFQPVSFDLRDIVGASGTPPDSLRVEYTILGSERVHSVDLMRWPLLDENLLKHDPLRQTPNIEKFDFLDIDQTAKTITIRTGTWRVTETMIIPEGYAVFCYGGTELSLENNAMILSHSPLFFDGESDNKITIRSDDSTGRGLFVFETNTRSLFDNVVFDNLGNPAQGGWSLTGAVTFHEADVSFSACAFRANRCEDYVNIVRADSEIESCQFEATSADAFDGDFCTARFVNTTFVDIGNDAIDISGSVVEVAGITIIGAGDKGLSVGEMSRLSGTNVTLQKTEIGVAVKDLSTLDISSLSISETRLGFALYQKKPEYGQAEASVREFSSSDVETMYLVERGSSLSLNGEAVEPQHDEVESLLYGTVYGKDSK